MAAIFPTFDPNDFKQVLLKGARLTCDVCLVQVAIIEKANSLPEGWEMHRVTYPNALPEYALDIICPTCLADEQAYYAKLTRDIEEANEVVCVAERVRCNTCCGGEKIPAFGCWTCGGEGFYQVARWKRKGELLSYD